MGAYYGVVDVNIVDLVSGALDVEGPEIGHGRDQNACLEGQKPHCTGATQTDAESLN